MELLNNYKNKTLLVFFFFLFLFSFLPSYCSVNTSTGLVPRLGYIFPWMTELFQATTHSYVSHTYTDPQFLIDNYLMLSFSLFICMHTSEFSLFCLSVNCCRKMHKYITLLKFILFLFTSTDTDDPSFIYVNFFAIPFSLKVSAKYWSFIYFSLIWKPSF